MTEEQALKRTKTSCRDRDGEYLVETVKRTLEANEKTQEAKVFGKLVGKSKIIVDLRKQFAKEFQQKGFGFVQGSKWTSYLSGEEYRQVDSYIQNKSTNLQDGGEG